MTQDARTLPFVTLSYIHGGSVTYDTLEKAIDALDDLGLCMNWAQVNITKNLIILLYQGWVYQTTFERCVTLPFNLETHRFELNFVHLLWGIFKPFIRDDSVWASSITMTSITDLADKPCWHSTLVFMFDDEDGAKLKVIQEALDKVDDSHERIEGMVYYLD